MALVDACHLDDFAQSRDLVAAYKAGEGSLELFVAEQQEEFAQIFKEWKQERSVNQRDPFGDTPLHAAAAQGNLLLVRYLVSEGADVNAKNGAGSTPLHKAAAVAHINSSPASSLAVVQFLISQGADSEIKNNAGLLAEDYARLDVPLAVALMGKHSTQEEISVPKEKHGFLIGRNGNTREEIQMECRCTILIPPQKEASDQVKIVGRKEGIAAAKEKIQAVLAAEAAKEAANPQPTSKSVGLANGKSSSSNSAAGVAGKGGKGKEAEQPHIEGGIKLRFPLNREKHRYVIGQGGKTINQIRSEAKVIITVPKPEENDDAITLEGTMDNIDKAIKMIQAATAGAGAAKKTGGAPRTGGAAKGGPKPAGGSSSSSASTMKFGALPQTVAAKRAAAASSSAPLRSNVKPAASANVMSVKPASKTSNK